LPEKELESNPSWFGFLITLRKENERGKLIEYLESNNIQTRMLFASNMILHPCFDELRECGEGFRVIGDLKNTNEVLKNSFWIGVAPTINNDMLEFIVETFKQFFELNKQEGFAPNSGVTQQQ
ncbi:DegT/DnrJ/EryC1/StrS family aminotransferase, partial [Anaerorhabdus sp.]